MAGKKAVQDTRTSERAEWIGFLDYRLSDTELAELDAWQPKPIDIWRAVDELVESGFRLTLSYNPKQKLAAVTIIDDLSSRKSGGYALSSSDSDGASALKMAVFKHLKLDRDWSSLLGDGKPKGRRG